jgi:hypothetical protein
MLWRNKITPEMEGMVLIYQAMHEKMQTGKASKKKKQNGKSNCNIVVCAKQPAMLFPIQTSNFWLEVLQRSLRLNIGFM